MDRVVVLRSQLTDSGSKCNGDRNTPAHPYAKRGSALMELVVVVRRIKNECNVNPRLKK
jgi:hypothetical protein